MTPYLETDQIIVFEGDSLTNRKFGLSKDSWPLLRLFNWEKTWADILSETLFCWKPELNLTFQNCAVGGSSSSDLLKRLDTHVIPLNPNWVMFTIGTNDCNRDVPLKEFEDNLREYIHRLNTEKSCKVLMIGGFKACPPDDTEANVLQNEKFKNYFDLMKNLALETGNFYLDVGTPLKDKADKLYSQCSYHTIYSDTRHFNQIGSTIISCEVLKFLGYMS